MLFYRLLFTLLCFQIGLSQKQEPYKDFYDSGALKTEGFYLKDKKHGEWKSYYENGQLKRLNSYTNGKRNPDYIAYFENGVISDKTEKSNGLVINSGYYETGELMYERLNKSGYYKEYYKSGVTKVVANRENYELVGNWSYFDENGILLWEVTYKDGYREGPYKKYYSSGEVQIKGQNIKDKKQGIEERYYEDGKLEWKGYYKGDMLSKTWTKYDSDGIKQYKIKFKDGVVLESEGFQKIEPTIVPSGIYDKVPVYPGCENFLTNLTRRKCMSQEISKTFNKNFNVNIASNEGLTGLHRIIITFNIDKQGNITDVVSKTPYESLQKECLRVMKLLPKITPGKVREEFVVVPYTFPLVFQVIK